MSGGSRCRKHRQGTYQRDIAVDHRECVSFGYLISALHRELSAGDIHVLDIDSIISNDTKPDNLYIIDKDLCEVIDK